MPALMSIPVMSARSDAPLGLTVIFLAIQGSQFDKALCHVRLCGEECVDACPYRSWHLRDAWCSGCPTCTGHPGAICADKHCHLWLRALAGHPATACLLVPDAPQSAMCGYQYREAFHRYLDVFGQGVANWGALALLFFGRRFVICVASTGLPTMNCVQTIQFRSLLRIQLLVGHVSIPE